MKFLIYILSFAILGLSCITCEDVVSLAANSSEISSAAVEKSSTSADQDNCSPLCTCNCCGQPLLVFSIASMANTSKRQAPKDKLIAYNNQFISSYIQNIWQPPKLSNFYIG
ncbi:DUF6660 family protein [Pedobacter agri]|uniref:DUF6660 family protein n=1 Tax=Pedobacter agri TaxID=454586 RepID=UPI00292E6C29|nr:DUF6660 family protein [Pedobacter agri]